MKGPIETGAYYEREDGSIGEAVPTGDPGCVSILAVRYRSNNGLAWNPLDDIPRKRLTRRVWLVTTDPAALVAELRRLSQPANAFEDYPEQRDCYAHAADIVAKALGVTT